MTTPNIGDAELVALERGRPYSDHSETWHPTETTPDALPPHASVLEPIETGDALRDRPTVLLCPGCGTDLKEYPTGLPAYVSHLSVACPDCEVSLKRWAVVAIDVAYAGVPSPDTLARAVQRYWERHLWAGIQTSGEYARTEEFTKAYQRLAAQLDWDWELTCPLCRRPMSELGTKRLEYHHWTRGHDDQGICLCRPCHTAISDDAYDAELDWQARKLGLRGKDDLQIARLAVRATSQVPASDYASLADRLVARYNLPYDATVVRCLLRQVFDDDELRATLQDPSLTIGGGLDE